MFAHWIWFSVWLQATIGMRLANVRHEMSYDAYPDHIAAIFENDVICEDNHGNVYIYMMVEDNSTVSKVTSVNENCINIQIEKGGKVNEKLIEFVAKVLGIRKQGVLLSKGFFTPEKVLLLDKCYLSALDVEARLRNSISSL